MNRAAFVVTLALGVLATPIVLGAQQTGKVYRIGVLSPGAPSPGPLEAFREGLRDFGYMEGRTIVIEWRFAEGKNERLSGLAEELVRLKVDVIFAVNTPAAWAAKKATMTIPIVIARLADPTKTGLVPSLAHPGGNITGLSSIAEEVATKRLQLVKDTLPGVTRVVMLFNAENPGHLQVTRETVQASTQLGIQLDTHGVRAIYRKYFRLQPVGAPRSSLSRMTCRSLCSNGPSLTKPLDSHYPSLPSTGNSPRPVLSLPLHTSSPTNTGVPPPMSIRY